MAVGAVLSEPLSRPDSLVSGINTGIFHGFCGKCHSIIPSILMNPGDLSRLPLDEAPTEQGI